LRLKINRGGDERGYMAFGQWFVVAISSIKSSFQYGDKL